VRDAVFVEKASKPVVAIVTDEFRAHGINIANMEGHAALKQLILPYPLENTPEEYLRKVADEYYPKFLDMIGAAR
jgi:hypothetical protein